MERMTWEVSSEQWCTSEGGSLSLHTSIESELLLAEGEQGISYDDIRCSSGGQSWRFGERT